MRLADFILSSVEPILAEWEIFARSIRAGEHLDELALRDHAGLILQATAQDMKSPQTVAERAKKSKGKPHSGQDSDALDGASDMHAVDRLGLGFDMLEVMSEYRALRASVLQLWHDSSPGADERDVSDLTRFNESIDQSLAKATASYTKRVDQARDMFLAILSHDLRNPLGAIAMSAHVLPMVTDDKAEIIECGLRIARSATVMERMISDLLDYTRTRLGAGMPVKPALLDLAALGRELFEEYREAFPKREIEFRAAGDLHGLWDSDRVRQAISNLIGNAIQHGSEDFPVSLSLRGEEALAMLHVRKPSLLVLDVNMPEMDGLTVLKTIKEHEELKDVRIAMYSADTQHETMTEAKRLGALDFMVKGTIGFDKLVARICELAGETV